jgi:A/G-specific adenine glycosylase
VTAPAWPRHLLRWYAANRREMPWRGHPDPYAVWVSEIMLQQTRVETVRPYFARFLARYPDPRALAAAPTGELLKCWEGLGYYARARHLQAAARLVMAWSHGQLPRTSAELASLPGIGPYTAAAIASICFGERVPVVDGNVARVFSRFLGWRDDFRRLPARQKLARWLTPHLPPAGRVEGDCSPPGPCGAPTPGDFNQAMMELGALICLPRHPACGRCPLAATCRARRSGSQADYPFRPPRKHVPVRHACGVLLHRRGRILLVQRPPGGLLGGFWELPGGASARPPGVRMAANLVRRQTGLAIAGLVKAARCTHEFSHFRLELALFAAAQASGRVRGRARWCAAADLARLPVATVHRRALRHPLAALDNPAVD